jgi:multiple sugar transport system ATP-binding protein
MAVSVRLERLDKRFGRGARVVHAVRDLTLEIGERELFTFVGPSGCGKTTTLRMIAGLESPTSGRVWFGDTDVTALPPQKRDIAMVFQDVALFPYMTVRDNIGYPLRIAGVARARVDDKVEQVAATLGLGDKLGQKPGQLSGGQQQRVAIGRAIIKEPRVLLMDEPLSALDARLRVEMRTEILRLHRELAATIVYVTHDQVEAMTMSTRVAVMDQGRALQIDPPRRLFGRPADMTVATFIGTPAMNIIPVAVATTGSGLAIELLGRQIPVAARHHAALQGLKRVEVGVRPQALRLVAPGPDVITGRVFLREPLGLEDEVLVETADGTRVKVVTAAGEEFPEGAAAGLDVAPRELYVFDSTSGSTLCYGIDG